MGGSQYRSLPAVDKILSDRRMQRIVHTYPHHLVVNLVREVIEEGRNAISEGKASPIPEEIIKSVVSRIKEITSLKLRYVINASGVILHTNLGRAPLSREAADAMAHIASTYCNLEFEMERGTRGSRNIHLEPVLCRLTGAEAALVVNNNAAAVMLVLTALARRKEVIVSRGQAVEIGGGFRVPDVMRQSGAKLVEVGTTNCTYDYDYERAITPRTAALLRVHPSNFRVEGFVHSVSLDELVAIGRKYDIPVLDDLGSGCLLDTSSFGLDMEPRVQDSIASGAGIATFSGDKLLGGPQAGIIVGCKKYIDILRKHPLARALRIDKMTIAGLGTTLLHYMKDEAALKIPVWRMISTSLSEIEKRAFLWAEELGGFVEVIDGQTMLGGGSLPGTTIPTKLVSINKRTVNNPGKLIMRLNRELRRSLPPIISRIGEDTLYLDPRTVLPEQDIIVINALKHLAQNYM